MSLFLGKSLGSNDEYALCSKYFSTDCKESNKSFSNLVRSTTSPFTDFCSISMVNERTNN